MTLPALKKRTLVIEAEILERLSNGEPLAVICRSDPKFPHPTTWNDWCASDEKLNIAHGRAREAGFDAIACDALEIIDAPPERVISTNGEEQSESRIDSASVQWAKNRVETRLKLLAKWDPKRYGELIKHGNADGSNIDLSDRLTSARERVMRGD